MKVNSVTVKNYRNLHSQTIALNSGLNVFWGNNAQGKTNFLESVYLCCIGKSARTEKDKDLIAWKQSVAHVKTNYSCRFGEGEIAIGIAGNKKHVSVNSVPISKLGDLLGYLNCIYFSPADIKIVSQSPAERRKFLDVDLCQMDKNYFYSLGRFNKALAQRNNLLKQGKSPEELKEVVFMWDEQIAREGAKIVAKRKQFCQKLKVFANQSHQSLTSGKENLVMEYLTQVSGETLAELEESYSKLLADNFEKDCQLRYTTAGCQRDDVMLKIGNVDVRTFGSQGQQRSTALALKLAELEIFNQINGEYPVLLLDDVLSELDMERQRKLLAFAKCTQVLITTATPVDDSLVDGLDVTIFEINDGLIRKQK
ncbi:MAG: DNA replication/repair protein RecF [Clostridia bacterium]|nr:DNA replication/repair protein RecF [Clostridia bacterium]